LRLAAALAVLVALLGPTLAPQRAARADAPDALTSQATLETRAPVVQWSVAGAIRWLTVDPREIVRAGDRVRTGPDASARLVYFEGTVIEVAPSTGLLVERLEASPSGSIVTRLLQTAGVTVSRVVHLVDPAASFEIETPAAVVMVRGTTPRVEVAPDGTSHVRNVPDGTASRVFVRGKDPAQTEVVLLPGQETDVAPDQLPAPPRTSFPTATSTPTMRTFPLPGFPAAPPTPAISGDPCQRPGVVCEPFPSVDPCRVRRTFCGPGGPGTTTTPTATPSPTPRPSSPTPTLPTNPCQRPGVVCDPLPPTNPCQRPGVVCDPLPPTPSATPLTNPCQRPGIVCDPLPPTNPCQRATVVCDPAPPTNPCQRSAIICDPPPVDPCRLRASLCGPGGQEPATPVPTRGLPPIGDPRPFPTFTVPQVPVGDVGGGRAMPTIPQLPGGDVGGGRTVPTLPQLPVGDLGSRGVPPVVVSSQQAPPHSSPSGPVLR
jgi:hypothetical protein